MPPSELLTIWQSAHGQLTPAQKKEFFARSETRDLVKLPRDHVVKAIQKHKKLTDALKYARSLIAQEKNEKDLRRASRTPRSTRVTGRPPASPAKEQFAAQLRENQTSAERRLGKKLSKRKETWFAQVPLRGFIADFYCPQALLVVEVDGPSHNHTKAYDTQRDEALKEIGIKTLRFTNDEVYDDAKNVLTKIRREFDNRKSEAFKQALLDHEWNLYRYGTPEKPEETSASKPSKKASPPRKFQWYCYECPGYFASLNRNQGRCPKNKQHRVQRICEICKNVPANESLVCPRCSDARAVALEETLPSGPRGIQLKQSSRGKRVSGSGR